MICDINRHSPTQAPRHQHSLTQSQVSVLKEKTCDLSPTQSILSNANSSDKSSKFLARKKSLKRVSFEEEPSIIEDSPEPFQDTQEEPDLDCDLPLLEEVEPPSPLDTLPVTPPVTMAAADEQIEIPSEAGEGEQMIPKKERKPHVKGITFREFDVSHSVLVSLQPLTLFSACEGLRGPREDHRDPLLRGGAGEAPGDGGLDSEG